MHLWARSCLSALLVLQSAAASESKAAQSATPSSAHQWNIVTWGRNTPAWNSRLKVNHIEFGCRATPQ